jgi:DNA-binding HxlR family transcriptional regulator
MTKDLITCPIENTLRLMTRKWTIVLIRDMFAGKKYFREFSEGKDGLSNTVLSDTLKFMEKNELIVKGFFAYFGIMMLTYILKGIFQLTTSYMQNKDKIGGQM